MGLVFDNFIGFSRTSPCFFSKPLFVRRREHSGSKPPLQPPYNPPAMFDSPGLQRRLAAARGCRQHFHRPRCLRVMTVLGNVTLTPFPQTFAKRFPYGFVWQVSPLKSTTLAF
jgi:hypothetical protein